MAQRRLLRRALFRFDLVAGELQDKALSAHRSKLHFKHDELALTVSAASDEPELPLRGSREELLRHSLARLSREYGEVIDLVYYYGKSVKEVAQIVGTDERTVRSRVHDARRRLAEGVELRTYALALKSRPSRTSTLPGVRAETAT